MDQSQHNSPRLFSVVIAGVMLVIGLAVGYMIAPNHQHETHEVDAAQSGAATTLYTCGMHPEIISDEPGICPKCQMKLTPMDADRAAMILEARGETGQPQPMVGGPTIRIDPVTEQNMGVRYDEARLGVLQRTVRAVGIVAEDENTLGTVTTKVPGYVEAVHVSETGTVVESGQPLFDLYSPELYSAQQELLVALHDLDAARESGQTRVAELAESRLEAARARLRYYDISDAQIAKFESSGEISKTLTITAKSTGVVTERNIVEGDSIQAGEVLYRISDLSKVWVLASIYESDLPFVHEGQSARMTLEFIPGKTYEGTVTRVYPYLEKGTREIRARVEFDNPAGELKPGMYATVKMESTMEGESILVPRSSVINTGDREVVFVRTEPGRFESRVVRTGLMGSNDDVQVLEGLHSGETVVVSGQFLLDSESRLREATLRMLNIGTSSATPEAEEPTEPLQQPQPSADGTVLYTCPMESHAHIVTDAPGRCPECNMVLVPTSEVDHGPQSEAIWKQSHAH